MLEYCSLLTEPWLVEQPRIETDGLPSVAIWVAQSQWRPFAMAVMRAPSISSR